MACILGENREIFFPKPNNDLKLTKFTVIAKNFLNSHGYDVEICRSEGEARSLCKKINLTKKWPCYFFPSDTTGEKPFEEFYTNQEEIDWTRFEAIGVIKKEFSDNLLDLENFERSLLSTRAQRNWTRQDLVELIQSILPEFDHVEKNKSLEQRM